MSPDSLQEMYRSMLLIRMFEERVRSLTAGGLVPGLVHLSAGQEAVAVGVCSALASDDYMASTHRGHGHCLAKGADPKRLLAEILGRDEGYSHGRGGSLHIFDLANGNLGTNGIVGGGIPLATGAALAAVRRGTRQVAVCFFGDGALNQGLFFECINMAAIWVLPILFVCENNGYGEYTASETVTAGDISARGRIFNVPSATLDGMDVSIVNEWALAAVERARSGSGPSFVICNTYRFGGHHVSDKQDYKSSHEAQLWRERDPIEKARTRLLAETEIDESALESIATTVRNVIDDAVTFARNASEPAAQDVLANVYG